MADVDYPTLIRWALAYPSFVTFAYDHLGQWLCLNTVSGLKATPINLN